ncbi:hypothetical protein SERLA73DRAFT_143588 [Serpula lacrymans var. lacrymans S7.3]|uniref:Secreted protein n=2 Tax=Serpula lacrymans var. lacrymans TaxID=341189 RepID=F8QAE0_SERL3|nr:uncharacterized protein SERLADRAFT_400355 [Serpula lacrymans var. lacrymans S7.9]EGN94730.1 hypothetical protein SERLA73DRAFT_143588 [Serpula lacrymans var. lacrymans S7.3]EGO20210.1 hypothetical protein SERLADRAFT_400355 [Serpula lacrymans var. lacrymans S7.9]
MKFTIFALALASTLVPAIYGSPATSGTDFTCEDQQVVSTSYIGEAQNVKSEIVTCSNTPKAPTSLVSQAVPVNVCGATCTTNCFTPSGGGPDPNDCQVIADALLYDSQNVGALFNITAATSGVVMQYQSCETFFIDQASYNLTYCRTDWSSLVNYIAFNCQATQNAHGGNCVASDQTWFVQVQTST